MLHETPLPDSAFTLRYRNSVYGSVAEERFDVTDDGRMRLRELAADDPAVLTEYYQLAEAPMRADDGADRAWVGRPLHDSVIDQLPLAATERGERTLLVPGQPPVELWKLVAGGEPGVLLSVDRDR